MPLNVAIVTCALGLLLAIGWDQSRQATAAERSRVAVIKSLDQSHGLIQSAVNERLNLLNASAAYLRTHWGRPNLDPDFDRFAAILSSRSPVGVRAVNYSVDGRIVHAWPRQGNEAAIGRDLLSDPEQSVDMVRLLADTGILVSGPVELYQGGLGLIVRRRLQLPVGTVAVVVALVLDFPTLLRDTRLAELTEVRWRLVDDARQFVAGEAWTDALGGRYSPVSLPIRFARREWHLEAVPLAGWEAAIDRELLPERVAAAALVGLATILAWGLAIRHRAHLDAEQAAVRRHAEEKFHLLFNLVPDGVVLAQAADARILEVNEAYCRIFRRPREAMIGRTMKEVGLMDTEEAQAAALSELEATGGHSEVPFDIRLPDGTTRHGIYSSIGVLVEGTPCYLSIVRDVHDRRRIEQQLTESQRLEAIGRLAGGIAHDFNNIITGIAGYATLAQQGLGHDDPRLADLDEISRAAQRAAGITRQLLTFARRQVTHPETVDLCAVVRQAQGLLRRLGGEAVRLEISVPDTPVWAVIDPAQFEQVLTNLVVNACHAMPHGGEVRLHIEAVGPEALISVADRGTGIAPEVMPHIFEPFYTTKPQGVGTGLGLSMVRSILEEAGGRIEVTSEVGSGSTFRASLPLVVAPADAGETTTSPVPFEPGKGLILLVEDEPQIRTLTTRVLNHMGYHVLSAEDGTEALALAAAHHGPISLLLTDMVMPRMGGAELVTRLREWRPELPVLLMSGYSEELVRADHPEHPFLAKPFTPDELRDAIGQVLNGH